ncbi:unnamed protein product [Sphagnum jensenii]|uniref:Uncharacterized protein n=1 Tax=Sphagnum jensenii TaxID=128206 RepID=A0ABP0ZXA8_9BRYO
MLEIRHKYVPDNDLLFGSIVVWGSEHAAYRHQSSSRCHKRHMGTQLVESLLQWTQVCRGFLTVIIQKLPHYLLKTLFHYQPTENWMNCELQGLCAIWHNFDALASLLPGVDLHVYGNPVHMLPIEDFLSLCILWKALHGGSLVVISRVYPTVAIGDLANLYLFNNCMTPITVRSITTWHMSQVIMTPY